ncbi:type VI secretion system tip protein TssI/VgrG [Thaumasiovibrio sp. DFM-14]|uniref:type VI secretion system tip protein TssI/VgrG n=1 Tax=Thaumasiovibrio sp. DFM-14 TaxID=3384792 RepID=UPI00399F8729
MSGDTRFEFVVPECEHLFRVEGFQVQEYLFQPFQISLNVISEDADIEFETLLRQAGVLSLFGQGTDVSRVFHGVINEVRFLGAGRRFSRYQISLVPAIWFLSQRQDCRIFQTKSVRDIVDEVLADAKITDYRWDVTGDYAAQEYILQYRESDLDFIHRIMSQHGMWYFFEHHDAGHTMVIVDSNDVIAPLYSSEENSAAPGDTIRFIPPGGGLPDREHVFGLDVGRQVKTSAVTLSDYDYRQPNLPLMMGDEQEIDNDLAFFDYPGRYRAASDGHNHARFLVAAHHVNSVMAHGQGCVMRMTPGYSFALAQHPRAAVNTEYLLVGIQHYGSDPQVHEEESSGAPTSYSNQFAAVTLSEEFKVPACPAPVIEGPQTAVVVGPQDEEIYTDEMGRIKVQFHWDRYGEFDDNSTCWIRVSQSMAAPNWGAVYLPRVGHEVVVTFMEGNPDRPLVTGAVYNGAQPLPYSLPDNKTRTTIRTQTHKGEGYNELSFEDENGREQLYMRAQRNMVTDVLNDQHTDIGHDQHLKVGRHQINEIQENQYSKVHGAKTAEVLETFDETVHGDVTVSYKSNETVTIAEDAKADIGKDRHVRVGGSDTLAVEGHRNTNITENHTAVIDGHSSYQVGETYRLQVQGATSIQSSASTEIISADNIVLKAGNAQISMNKSGAIRISGTAITIDGSDKVIVTGGKVAIN